MNKICDHRINCILTVCVRYGHGYRSTFKSPNLKHVPKIMLRTNLNPIEHNVRSGTTFSSHSSDPDDFGSQQMAGMRKEYKGKQDVFDIDCLEAKEPFKQFAAWFEEARSASGIMEANAMALATATRDGRPSVRMVLMKGLDERGIVFYTNYLSQKSQDLNENPQCSLMFFWEPLMKSVRIEGKVEKVSEEESNQYFLSRPRSSQIGACVSVKQSSLIESREALDKRSDELNIQYADESVPVPKPDYWGGFRVIPYRFEFWQGQTNRIHDRIVFRKPEDGESIDTKYTHQGDNGWVYERLMP